MKSVIIFIIGMIVGYVISIVMPLSTIVSYFLANNMASSTAQMMRFDSGTNGDANTTVATNKKPIALKDLPLTDAQKKMAETFGINVETFVISPTMITCAEGKLGEARMQEIIAGGTPSFTESMSLMTRLGS